MKFSTLIRLFALWLVFCPILVQAVVYRVPMNQAQWQVELSQFECRIWQPIPAYGDAVFQYRAGEQQRFFLAPAHQSMRKGKASLVVAGPVWDSERRSHDLGYVAVKDSDRPVDLAAKRATRLLAELYEGMSPIFTRKAWFGQEKSIQVALSSVHFRKAYEQYRQCLAGLLPVNYEQIARSRLGFPPARWELSEATRKRLDLMVIYFNADPTITGFFIDGHTDNAGRRLYNLDLSKKRAEAVSEYLLAAGIDESLITTRYHGERYPVAKNNTRANRQKNRRVTVRVERKSP